jgi:hypothetical protein
MKLKIEGDTRTTENTRRNMRVSKVDARPAKSQLQMKKKDATQQVSPFTDTRDAEGSDYIFPEQ